MIRILIAAPLLIAGETISTLGYIVAGSAHRNPHRRLS